MGSLILHKLNPSPPARSVMIVAEILGLKLHYKDVILKKGDHHKPEFVNLNPMKTIPVLQDGEFVLADSHAICTYLINRYGKDKREELYPSEVMTRAIVDQRLHLDTGFLFPRLAAVAFPTLRGESGGASEDQVKDIEEGYKLIDVYLKQTKYFATDHVTVADICAGTTITSQEIIIEVDGGKFPKTKEWIENLKKKHYFQKMNAPGLEEFKIFLNIMWEKYKQKNMT